MSYLKVEGLKIFKVDDGEEWYILAENEEQAREYFEYSGECIDESDILEACDTNKTDNFRDCYSIEEITQDSDLEIIVSEDIDLVNTLTACSQPMHDYQGIMPKCFENSYKEWQDEEDEELDFKKLQAYVKIWDYIKHSLIIDNMLGTETKLPKLICGSIF